MNMLSFGTATRDITPSYPVMTRGYASRDHCSHGVAEPISLAVWAVSDGHQTVLLISLDLIGIPTHVCLRLYALLQEATGIAFPNILLSCSHTHFAPGLHTTIFPNLEVGLSEPDPRFVAEVETKLVEASTEAVRGLAPAVLEHARIEVPSVLFNRRTVGTDGRVTTNYLYPADPTPYRFSPVDPQLTVLRFRGPRGIRGGWLNFGCHPVTGTGMVEDGHYRISADYPYYLRRGLEDAWHCPTVFTLGAAGDAVPLNRQEDCRLRIGRALADAAVLAERTYRQDPVCRVAAAVEYMTADTIIHTDAATADMMFQQAHSDLQAMHQQTEPADGTAGAAAAGAFAEAALHACRGALYPENTFAIPVQYVSIGATQIVALPFEVLAEISLRVKTACPSAVLVSCAGGYQGYLPLACEYDRGGYEATPESTHFVPGTADRILGTVLARCAVGTL